jgi:AcrR family transcriptional regulator
MAVVDDIDEVLSPGGRTYGGETAAERQLRRREQFLDAGLDLFGTEGFRNATVRGVIKRTGLAERYFYESFSTLDELLIAVYERIVQRIIGATLEALESVGPDPRAQARAGLAAFVQAVTADPRAARVQLFEVVGVSDVLEGRRREIRQAFAGIITERMPAAAIPGLDRRVLAMALVGAVHELLTDHVLGVLPADLGGAVDHLAALFDHAIVLVSGDEPAGV